MAAKALRLHCTEQHRSLQGIRGGVDSNPPGWGWGFLEEMTSELSCKVGAGAGQKGGWGEDGLRDTEIGLRIVMSKNSSCERQSLVGELGFYPEGNREPWKDFK